MKKRLEIITCILVLALISSCRKNSTVLLIGVDDSGNEIEKTVPSETFIKAAADTFAATNNSTLEMLASKESPEWNVDKVEVGVGVNFTVGTDHLWKWSYNPGYRLIYQKNK